MSKMKIDLVTVNVNGEDVSAKLCTGCMKTKPLQEFSNSSDGSAGGKQSKCKQCRSDRFKNTYKPSHNITRLTEMIVNGENVQAKICTMCKVLKPLTEYSNVPNGVGGKLSKCKECGNKKSREYKDRNREKLREYDRLKWASNKEAESLKKKKYYNKDKSSERYKVWASKNKGRLKVRNMNRVAKLNNLKSELTLSELNEIMVKFKNNCALTGSLDFEFDHFIAISTGEVGTVKRNIVPMCKFLNGSKKNRNPFEWIKLPHIQEMIIPGSFERLIEYLAEENSMTVDEYKEHVYKCYDRSQNA